VALAPDLYNGNITKSPDEAGKLFMALRGGLAADAGLPPQAARLKHLDQCPTRTNATDSHWFQPVLELHWPAQSESRAPLAERGPAP